MDSGEADATNAVIVLGIVINFSVALPFKKGGFLQQYPIPKELSMSLTKSIK